MRRETLLRGKNQNPVHHRRRNRNEPMNKAIAGLAEVALLELNCALELHAVEGTRRLAETGWAAAHVDAPIP